MSTKADPQRFLAHLRYWQKVLNLNNYTIEVSYNYEGVGADCEMNHPSLCSKIRIGEVDEMWDEAYLARHEMFELLLEPLKSVASRDASEDDVYRKGHEIVHRLESVVPLPTDKEVGYMPCGKKKKKPKGK